MTRSCRVFLSINKAESVVRFLERHVCLVFKSGSPRLQQLSTHSFHFNGDWVSQIHHNVTQNISERCNNLYHTTENTASRRKRENCCILDSFTRRFQALNSKYRYRQDSFSATQKFLRNATRSGLFSQYWEFQPAILKLQPRVNPKRFVYSNQNLPT